MTMSTDACWFFTMVMLSFSPEYTSVSPDKASALNLRPAPAGMSVIEPCRSP